MNNLTWKIGDITITKLSERGESVRPGGGDRSGIPDAYPEEILGIPWLIPGFANEEGHLRMSVHALLVQTPEMRIIVDTCVGNDKRRAVPDWSGMTTDFLDRLTAAGWHPDTVDAVLCTHLHVDHVGWNTVLRDGEWVPTFPNARYYMAQDELEHWTQEIEQAPEGSPFVLMMMDTREMYLDSVKPILDAGLACPVDTDAQIAPGVSLFHTPGHTPGHVSVLIQSRDERAVITGDMMHHPCQIARPRWSSAFDSDSEQSRQTRRSFLAEFADTSTLIIGTHFAGPTAGHIFREGTGYRFQA